MVIFDFSIVPLIGFKLPKISSKSVVFPQINGALCAPYCASFALSDTNAINTMSLVEPHPVLDNRAFNTKRVGCALVTMLC